MNSDGQDENLVETLLANSQPAEVPQNVTDDSEQIQVFSNYEWDDSTDGTRRRGLPTKNIRDDLFDMTGGWPKRVGDVLFAEGPNHTPLYLDSPTELFAWLDDSFLVDWWRGSDAVTQERFCANLRMSAEAFESVELYPHWPPLPNTYYMHPPLPETDGSHLHTLVGYFAPLTSVDTDLVRAFILSLFWGGEPGSRPAWLIIGPDNDHGKGRGVGKSSLVAVLSDLVGGLMDFSPTDEVEAIKKRLLSPDARPYRVARVDNIKTHRFSWADLEGLITSPMISGHRMYRGEGRRPNTITWALTLNGASLSKDMAQRCVIMKLDRPQYNPRWEQDVRSYIDSHRWEIIADIGQVLHGQQEEGEH